MVVRGRGRRRRGRRGDGPGGADPALAVDGLGARVLADPAGGLLGRAAAAGARVAELVGLTRRLGAALRGTKRLGDGAGLRKSHRLFAVERGGPRVRGAGLYRPGALKDELPAAVKGVGGTRAKG